MNENQTCQILYRILCYAHLSNALYLALYGRAIAFFLWLSALVCEWYTCHAETGMADDCALAGYFSKLLGILLSRSAEQILKYLKASLQYATLISCKTTYLCSTNALLAWQKALSA